MNSPRLQARPISLIAVAVFFLFCAAARGADEAPRRKPASFLSDTSQAHHWFGFFELNAFAALQSDGSYSVAPYGCWKPTFALRQSIAIRGNIGITAIKNTNPTQRVFLATEYELLVALGIDRGVLELGGGLQNWQNNGGFKPVVSANVGVPIVNYFLGFIDRFVIGYSLQFSTPSRTHEIKLGIGVAL